ncbi:hypothetical protein [Rhizobium sp. FKL33]|uniref:hypothetical protein n=1 Tax=Rhizobium sp. FKL33 TaxID=2562307 RepID=UPI0010C12723|nr:hypothetical protein [Rhizobium sp. FKL33]
MGISLFVFYLIISEYYFYKNFPRSSVDWIDDVAKNGSLPSCNDVNSDLPENNQEKVKACFSKLRFVYGDTADSLIQTDTGSVVRYYDCPSQSMNMMFRIEHLRGDYRLHCDYAYFHDFRKKTFPGPEPIYTGSDEPKIYKFLESIGL